jgi:glucose-6-phosphate 1-epimerase
MHPYNLDTLNKRFGLSDILIFKEGPGGLPVVEVLNEQASAVIALQGAHLLQWVPTGEEPVIWLSPEAKFAEGKSVRGGVPVCWPWFGPHEQEAGFPAHGFARTVPWEVFETNANEDGSTTVGLRLLHNDATRAQWPGASELELYIRIGTTLELDLLTRNTSSTAITIGEALHTYFQVSDIREVSVQGLEDLEYIDKVDGAARKRQEGLVRFSGEVDRIYLDHGSDCLIHDPGLQRRIRIHKRGSHSTVVWNPWIEKAEKMGDLGPDGYLRMLCVECANAAEDVVKIGPGGEHHLWMRYSVESL